MSITKSITKKELFFDYQTRDDSKLICLEEMYNIMIRLNKGEISEAEKIKQIRPVRLMGRNVGLLSLPFSLNPKKFVPCLDDEGSSATFD